MSRHEFTTLSGITPLENKAYYTWQMFDEDVQVLASQIPDDYKLIAVHRGGLVPGVAISHLLGRPFEIIRMQMSWSVEGENLGKVLWRAHPKHLIGEARKVALIDEIYDTGATFDAIKNDPWLQDCDVRFFTLTTKGRVPTVELTTARTYLNNPWLVFPWENK